MAYKSIEAKRAYDRRYWLKVKAGSKRPAQRPIGVVRDLRIRVPRYGLKIAALTDVQAMPGVNVSHLAAYGEYIAEKRPDVIVCLGDFGDFPSLSHYERGTVTFEGRRYQKDLDAYRRAMDVFMAPIARVSKYNPYLEFTHGNHENQILRYEKEHPEMEGTLSLKDLRLAEYGWRAHEFLQPVAIGGVAFCHYFPSGVMGRPITTAAGILRALHMSAFAGHQQGRDVAYSRRADGGNLTAIISGSFYSHSYDYLSPFTNAHWRGTYFLHEVKDGQFSEMALSLDYLKRRYGKK